MKNILLLFHFIPLAIYAQPAINYNIISNLSTGVSIIRIPASAGTINKKFVKE